MTRLTDEEYEALTGPLIRQNQKNEVLAKKLTAWEKTSPAATWLTQLFEKKEIPGYYFGGVCRDVWNNKSPRDIDIVIDPSAWREFYKEILPFQPRKNSFGGLKFSLEGTEVDAWPLEQTWAFTQKLSAPASPTHLPETTLLNIESVVAMVWHPEEKIIFQRGFYRSMETRTLELQTIHPPLYPALALARIEKFLADGWQEGESIKAFRNYFKSIPRSEIETAKTTHYKR